MYLHNLDGRCAVQTESGREKVANTYKGQKHIINHCANIDNIIIIVPLALLSLLTLILQLASLILVSPVSI